MNIVHVCESYFPIRGGAEVHIDEVYKKSHLNGITCKIVTSKVDSVFQDLNDGILRWNISERGLGSIVKFPFLIIKLCFLIRKNDLVHAHYSSCLAAAASIACKLVNRPIVVTLHGRGTLESSIENSQTAKLWRFLSMRLSSALIAPSKEIQELAEQISPKQKIVYIPNGVNTSIFKPRQDHIFDNRNIKFVILRRLTPKNGVFFALKAITELAKENKTLNYYVEIIGDGPEKNKIQKFLTSNNLINLKVRFHGALNHTEVIPIAQICDFSVFFSSAEAVSLALLETMSIGIIPICTPIGGLSEVVKSGINGLLSNKPISNTKSTYYVQDLISLENFNELVKCLKMACDLKDNDYKIISQNAVKTASTFDWNEIFIKINAVYSELLQ